MRANNVRVYLFAVVTHPLRVRLTWIREVFTYVVVEDEEKKVRTDRHIES